MRCEYIMKCYDLYLPDSRYGLHDCTWLNFQMSICLKQQPNIALMHPIYICGIRRYCWLEGKEE